MAVRVEDPTRSQTPPPPPSRRRYIAAVVVAVAVCLVVAAIALAVTSSSGHNSKTRLAETPATTPVTVNNGTAAQVTSPPANLTTPTNGAVTPTTVLGPTGDPADWPAAQATPPSLAGAFSNDFAVVAKTLLTYQDWVFSHPNPALVDDYMLPNSAYYTSEKQALSTLVSSGWHANPKPSELDFLKVTLAPKQQFYSDGRPATLNGHNAWTGGSVTLVLNINASTYLDASDNVTVQRPATGQTALGWIFVQGSSDGRWRISSEYPLNPPGGIAQLEQP